MSCKELNIQVELNHNKFIRKREQEGRAVDQIEMITDSAGAIIPKEKDRSIWLAIYIHIDDIDSYYIVYIVYICLCIQFPLRPPRPGTEKLKPGSRHTPGSELPSRGGYTILLESRTPLRPAPVPAQTHVKNSNSDEKLIAGRAAVVAGLGYAQHGGELVERAS
ncbi:hypothetical protein C8R44DRAFT_750248 [Mycena epipterygia]|nr:hypothetical protein C8R44DRAFT_750248 [Mycena epipterygia]